MDGSTPHDDPPGGGDQARACRGDAHCAVHQAPQAGGHAATVSAVTAAAVRGRHEAGEEARYLNSLTPIEHHAYTIAVDHLKSSFDLRKSVGFCKWQRLQQEQAAKEGDAAAAAAAHKK